MFVLLKAFIYNATQPILLFNNNMGYQTLKLSLENASDDIM